MEYLFLSDMKTPVKFNEGSIIDYLIYYDIDENLIKNLILKEKSLYITHNINHYGDIFIGNRIYDSSSVLLINKINPIFLLFKIVFNSTIKHLEKLLLGFKYMSIFDITELYKQELCSKGLFNSNQDGIIRFIDYINKLEITNEVFDIEDICNIRHISFSINKCISYVKTKVLSHIEYFDDEIEKEENKKEILFIVLPYIPIQLHDQLFEELKMNKNDFKEEPIKVNKNYNFKAQMRKVESKKVEEKGKITHFFKGLSKK